MLKSECPERVIVVEGIEITLPAVTAIPLGFVANELITEIRPNTGLADHGHLESNPPKGHALSDESSFARSPLLVPAFPSDPASRSTCYVAIIGVWRPSDRIYLLGFSQGLDSSMRCTRP